MAGTRFGGLCMSALAVVAACGGQTHSTDSAENSGGMPSLAAGASSMAGGTPLAAAGLPSAEGGRATAGSGNAPTASGGAARVPNREPRAAGGTRGDVGGGAGAGAGDVDEVCPASPTPRLTELVWRQELATLSGVMGPGRIAYSADGSQVVTPADQHVIRGYTVYGAWDGEALESGQIGLLDRDRSWSRELRAEGRGNQLTGLQVVDLQSGAPVLSLVGPPAAARLSDDGRYLAAFYCADAPRIERHALDGEDTVSLSLADQPSACQVQDYAHYENLAAGVPMAFSGASIAYAVDGRARIAIADLETRRIEAVTLVPESVSTGLPEDALLTLTFAPSGGLLASVVSRTVRVVHHPHQTRALPDFPAGVTLAFTDCYCEPRRFSPLAWSADERYFAMLDPDRAVVIRRSCDGAQVARIENPASSSSSTTLRRDVPGPAFLAFAPDGTALAVYSVVGMLASVSVYRLEE